MSRLNLLERLARVGKADDSDLVDVDSTQTLTGKTIASSAGLPYLSDLTNVAGAKKIAYGVSAFISGTKTVATGLATVLSFQCELIQTGAATGATEITAASVSGVTGAAIATGDVVVQGFRLNTATASASGTGGFFWMAIGT